MVTLLFLAICLYLARYCYLFDHLNNNNIVVDDVAWSGAMMTSDQLTWVTVVWSSGISMKLGMLKSHSTAPLLMTHSIPRIISKLTPYSYFSRLNMIFSGVWCYV